LRLENYAALGEALPGHFQRREHRMRRVLILFAMAALAVMVVHFPSQAQLAKNSTSAQYKVLNPWAEVDPKLVRGISPRPDTLAGKKVGLFANFKRAAMPIAQTIEKRLKEKYPDIQTSIFNSTLPNVTETETVNKEKFTAWAKGLNAVIAVVGD
jgi:hypothetical protein